MKTIRIKVPSINDVEFELECLEEDISPADQFEDQGTIDYVINEYNNGNSWAWFCAKVTAKWRGLEGTDYLGCCSYKDEKDFKENGGYYEDMKLAAFNDLIEQIQSLRK